MMRREGGRSGAWRRTGIRLASLARNRSTLAPNSVSPEHLEEVKRVAEALHAEGILRLVRIDEKGRKVYAYNPPDRGPQLIRDEPKTKQ